MKSKRYFAAVLCLAALTSCSKTPEVANAPPKDNKSPEQYRVTLDTTKGPVVIEVHREWAPLGSDRFYTLVKANYLDGAHFFRVIPGFMAQFGLAGDPLVTARWKGTELPDDPKSQSNTRGMITFATAGANTRTTQLFINYGDNSRLDEKGFTPFGRVVSGMEVMDAINSRYRESPNQGSIKAEGNTYLDRDFPGLDLIKSAKLGG